MRHYLTFLTALLGAILFSAAAYSQNQSLVVRLKSGERIYYNLEENPKTRFSDSNLIIETPSISATYPIADVQSYVYETATTGIDRDDRLTDIMVIQNGNSLVFRGLTSGTDISLYTLDGRLLKKFDAADDSDTIVSTDPLPPGVYIVTVKDASFKFFKK